jgi:crotonobetainyl-CoA:carnitine CoA-transferase CaiB-like acyl-CoA transferase
MTTTVAPEPMFAGVRVLEVATWQMVPVSACVLGDFGADVIKVERLPGGDPQRELGATGVPRTPGGSNVSMEQTNRGKRSIGLDLSVPAGRDVLYRLAETADVFLTNFLPPVRRKLAVDYDDIRARNERIIYACANALGSRGPEADKPGYDATAYSARGGVGHALRAFGSDRPAPSRPGFGDKQGAMNLAFGMAAALFRRERTGAGAFVETSLLASAVWATSSDLVASKATGRDRTAVALAGPNPLSGQYRTSDGRWLSIQFDNLPVWWASFCASAGRADLVDDRRFLDPDLRRDHKDECVAEVTSMFASATLTEVRTWLASIRLPWEVYQRPDEVLDDPQTKANDLVTEVAYPAGGSAWLVRAPVQFDRSVAPLRPAPKFGEDTVAILVEAGFDAGEIEELQADEVIA